MAFKHREVANPAEVHRDDLEARVAPQRFETPCSRHSQMQPSEGLDLADGVEVPGVRFEPQHSELRQPADKRERWTPGERLAQGQRAKARERREHVEARRVPQLKRQVLDVLEARQPRQARAELAAVRPELDVGIPAKSTGGCDQHCVRQRLVKLQTERATGFAHRRLDGRGIRVGAKLAVAVLLLDVERSCQHRQPTVRRASGQLALASTAKWRAAERPIGTREHGQVATP